MSTTTTVAGAPVDRALAHGAAPAGVGVKDGRGREDAVPALAVERALCRSALYEALALGFRAPTAEAVERLATPSGAAGLAAAAELLDLAAGDDADAIAPLVRRLADSASPPDALAEPYRRLFGHVVRGEAAAYETEYGGDDLFRQPQELADLGGFYAAFGLALAPAVGERPDHASCECEFMMFLARKEAVALERDDQLMLAETRKAERLFLRDHLGRFLPSLAERVRRAAPGTFYAALAALADTFIRRECADAGVSAGPESLALRAPVEDRIPMACGSCPLGAPDEPAEDE